MERTYTLNDIAMMTGFTTRTLRTYLTQGLLKGDKVNGAWQFTAEAVDAFFSEPYVKEGLRIKRSSAVFDFLADRKKKDARSCVILDVPCALSEGKKISDFFCRQMEKAHDVSFTFDWDGGMCRVIICGAEEQVRFIMNQYKSGCQES
ncbi:MAG: MerR family transcriptional regulator [Erysipelotrichaceae bacterium]|nr:MerR family transcriptional regulator [Erysipelotrichaceae bacterium]MDO5108828.1 MerR family transcriptional regulator [Erysipelotrichaceae bacterium]